MRKTFGVFAHVDGGKTTFSEQLLYHTGAIRKAGRVDQKNTLLDGDEGEGWEVVMCLLLESAWKNSASVIVSFS